ncbi:hypothetical protein [Micromonospora tarensis]|uniref:YD repeat-containing protein n=1 Tax=Micromonospora tarensis TaxID=2806100 RepID=A0ABS1YK55_9ACTN|nr:hypothetical protein [Micromonospora tarensis]MBM0277807.1 hypothetical protein [Micromonospora tarensis]
MQRGLHPEPHGCRSPFLIRRLASEPATLVRIETAERLGIAPRRLDGWEPAETTTYEHDGDGRLVRSVTVREPEWSEQDRAWMAALAAHRSGRCPSCGGDAAVCCAPDGDGAFVVPPPTRCHVTTALAVAQAQYQDSPQPQALLWHVERR